jgi:hypothetical protein
MELYINNEKIDFSLENESNLFDIFTGIDTWLEDSDLKIHSAMVNDLSCDISDTDMSKSFAVDKINKIELSAGTFEDIALQNIATVYDFFTLLKEALLKRNKTQIEELMPEYSYVRTYLSTSFTGTNYESADTEHMERFYTLLYETGVLKGKLPDEAQTSLIVKEIDRNLLLLAEKMREIDNPDREAAVAARLMIEFLPQVCDVSILLQTGKDKEAMNRVLRFSTLTQKIIRLLPAITLKSNDIQVIAVELKTCLEELTEAFQTQDSVLIGDILEYEITPKMEHLAKLILGEKEEEKA